MSIRVVVEIQAAVGKADRLQQKFSEVLGDTRNFDGCQSIELIRDQQESDRFFLLETWDDVESYKAYKAWRISSGTSVTAGDLVDEPAKQYICTVTDA